MKKSLFSTMVDVLVLAAVFHYFLNFTPVGQSLLPKPQPNRTIPVVKV